MRAAPSGISRVAIVSDAWHPQVNGVVRTILSLVRELTAMGVVVEVFGPGRFRTLPCPTYPEIRLALLPGPRLRQLIDAFQPDAVHIVTEGPLGWAMRRLCRRRRWDFTSSFHTKFAEYVHGRTGIPPAPIWAILRRFHAPSRAVLAGTPSLARELGARGFRHVLPWSRGVDLDRFQPDPKESFAGLARPVFLNIGRVAVEKNLSAFLELDLPGSKVVVGDGPQLAELRQRFPGAVFTGARSHESLAPFYAGADVFVFPSRTDTFGLVLLEALACGTPVAAYPVTGPADVIGGTPGIGALDMDLRTACLNALPSDRAACRRHAQAYSWSACASRFHQALVPVRQGVAPAGARPDPALARPACG